MKLVIIGGNGKWGQKYISTLSEIPNIEYKIADRNNWKSLIDELPDGVIVCTPPDSHIEIASYALDKNIPTMIEKPLSLSLYEAKKLEKYTTPILINNIHLFSNAYEKLKDNIRYSTIKDIFSEGYNNGPIRNYSSLWDYGWHDLSMILNLVGNPIKIDVIKSETNNGELFNISLTFSQYGFPFISESIVGNGAQERARKFKVNFDGLNIEYDDTNIPNHHQLPLKNALKVFLNLINGGHDDRAGLDLSFKIIEILEYCDNKLKSNH
jgi:predicted dehydrogenase